MHQAADMAQIAWSEHGERLQTHMQQQAPTLWGSVAPLIRQQRWVPRSRAAADESDHAASRWRPPRRPFRPTWPLGLLAVVFLHLVRLLIPDGSGSSVSSSTIDYPKPVVVNPSEEPSSAPPESLRAPEVAEGQVIEKQIAGSWGSLQLALRLGDCQTVQEQWLLYHAALLQAHVDPQVEVGREKSILKMCPELKGLLDDSLAGKPK
jgi:hypothetical protein